MTSALEYRDYNRGVYGVELPFIKPWTSSLEIMNVAMELFDSTAAFVESNAQSEPERVKVPRAQLPELAAVLFSCFSERLMWLQRYVGFSFGLKHRWMVCLNVCVLLN